MGWAVDTTDTVVRGIVETLVAYYRLPHPGRTATHLWSADEQAQYPHYDLTADIVYQRFPATVVDVTPAAPDSSLWDEELLAALPALLGIEAETIDSWWRAQASQRLR